MKSMTPILSEPFKDLFQFKWFHTGCVKHTSWHQPHFKLKWCSSNEEKASAKSLLESKATQHSLPQHSCADQPEIEKETPICAKRNCLFCFLDSENDVGSLSSDSAMNECTKHLLASQGNGIH